MKKLLSLLTLSVFLFISCSTEGDRGPQGPQGPPGEDGLGYTFEETVDFEYLSDTDNYNAFIDIPESVATINPDADAVLVYRLRIVEADDGGDLDTWSLLPQNFFLDEGTIQYEYNHTAIDVEVIINGNFDLNELDARFTENQTFRIVVLPSDYLQSTGVDVSNYSEVEAALKEGY